MFRGRNPGRAGPDPGPAIRGIDVLLLGVVVTACAPAHVSSIRTPEDVAREPNAVAVIAMERFALGAKSCDLEKTATCVRAAIARERPWVPVVTQEEFLQVGFPGLELEEVPSEPKYVELLLEDDGFQERIAKLRLGFLVVVGGLKRTRDLWGEYFCSVWPPWGMSCVGLEADEEETHLAATVFSLEQTGQRREVTASRKGREYWGVIVVIPIIKPAATMPPACREIAAEILRVIDELEAGAVRRVDEPDPGRNG